MHGSVREINDGTVVRITGRGRNRGGGRLRSSRGLATILIWIPDIGITIDFLGIGNGFGWSTGYSVGTMIAGRKRLSLRMLGFTFTFTFTFTLMVMLMLMWLCLALVPFAAVVVIAVVVSLCLRLRLRPCLRLRLPLFWWQCPI